MKQNPCPVVGKVTEPTGICLDELDGAVETFCELVFGRLLREKRIEEHDLNGHADEKLANIWRIAEL